MTAAALKRAAIAACLLSPVQGAVVAAGSLTSVAVEAPLYDERLAADGGCDPAGCNAGLTRDGDATTVDSRWSCKPELGGGSGTCYITYTLADAKTIDSLDVALYKGNERTRTVDIYIDDVKATTWTSSGSTTAFENVEIGVAGQTIELRGVLGVSEWLSIAEVEILVDDGTDDPVIVDGGDDDAMAVEAGTLGTVTTTADLYDSRLGDANGCDPDGCTAALTRDGDLSVDSRWSCSPSLGGACSISYDLGVTRSLSELRVAMYKGDERTRTMDIYVDGVKATTWTSSGSTTTFETVELGVIGQTIELRGVLGDSEWLSITEVEILVDDGGEGGDDDPVVEDDDDEAVAGGTDDDDAEAVEAGTVGTVTATAALYDPRSGSANGCDPDGCTAALTRDGDLSEDSRWSCASSLGGTCSISYDLGSARNLSELRLALYKGTTRVRTVEVHVDDVVATTWTSSGTTSGFEAVDLSGYSGRYVTVMSLKDDTEWLSIVETEIMVLDGDVVPPPAPTDDDVTPPPVATVTPSPVTAQPVSPGGTLQTVGLLPLAEGRYWSYPVADRFAAKDGDLTTSWTCTGDPQEPNDTGVIYYECELSFRLLGDRNIKQVKIALADGAEQSTEMRISGGGEVFVTSSGTTTDLETYEIDFNTYYIDIAAVFSEPGQSISISEVEFVEEVVEDEEVVVPGDTVLVGSTMIEWEGWPGNRYPDFVAQGTGDQHTINAAICAVKKGTYDGVGCVGMDETATGTVRLADDGYYMVDGSVVMQSGVFLAGYYNEDNGIQTYIALEEKAAGNTDIEAIVVMDGVTDAWMDEIWIRGLYDPDTDDGSPGELGPACLSVTNSQNVTARLLDAKNCDGDAMVVRNSNIVNIDAGRYDDELLAWSSGPSKGTGLIVDTSDSVWVRRTAFYDNAVAGLHISGSNNFTFEATFDGSSHGGNSHGSVGTVDGQQPIEIIIEDSSLLTFTDMRVKSINDPVMTIAGSTGVSFSNLGLGDVPLGTCVIETDDPTTVTIDAEEDEISLEGTCYVKV